MAHQEFLRRALVLHHQNEGSFRLLVRGAAVSFLRLQRHTETKPAALARLAIHPDPAAMLLDQSLGNCQAQAGALSHALCGGPDLVKSAEYGFVLLPRNADSGIHDAEACRAAGAARLERYASTCGREFDGVTQQIVENLFEP